LWAEWDGTAVGSFGLFYENGVVCEGASTGVSVSAVSGQFRTVFKSRAVISRIEESGNQKSIIIIITHYYL